jgi:hypothetical protein
MSYVISGWLVISGYTLCHMLLHDWALIRTGRYGRRGFIAMIAGTVFAPFVWLIVGACALRRK